MGLIHLQSTLHGWLEPVRRAPDYSLAKTVDQGQVFREVKDINSKIFTCLRHWYDGHQVFGGDFEANKERARVFFDTFIDGTFIDDIAEHCDYVEEWNEYIASSDTPEETAERVRWARAAAEVWRDEYRTIPGLSHIKLVLCNAAIGNWIHRDFAEVASLYDCAMGYHPYTAWGWDGKPKVRWGEDEPLDMGVLDTIDWVYLSGLWDSMEYDWGIELDWVFTEAGPFESATNGWKSRTCLGGDLDLYVASMRDWIRDVRTTPAYAEGRIKGFALFTMDQPNDSAQWSSYLTNVNELNRLADMCAVEWKPGTPVVKPDPDPDVNYRVVANLLAQNATKRKKQYVLDERHESKEGIMQSADDAARLVAPAWPSSKVVVWEPDNWGDDIDKWLRDHGVTNIEHQEFPFESPNTIIDIVDDLPKHDTLTYRTRALTEITTLTIHHTVSSPDRSIESIAAYHVAPRPRVPEGWPGIGYHFMIKDDGRIYRINYLETKSYHAGSLGAPGDENLWSVGIALQGDFTRYPPPQAQLDAARWLVADLKEQLDITQVLKHREMPGASTACPGATSDDWIEYVAG